MFTGGGFRSPGGDGGFRGRGGGRGTPRGRGGRGGVGGGRGGFRGGKKVTVEPHRHEGDSVILTRECVCVKEQENNCMMFLALRCVYLPWERRRSGDEEHGGGRVGIWGEENQC